jgi:hypothetical protein
MTETTSYPSDAGPDVLLLTVTGTPTLASADAARELHNATAGTPQSVAGAKSLGDLSHTVFLPAAGDALRLLFIDTWNSPSGLGQFFGNPMVQDAAAKLFSERDAVLWAPAPGFGSYVLPAPSGRAVAGVGILRAPVTSMDAARSAFHAYAAAGINRARLLGQVGHQVWVPAPVPGTEPAVEVLGVDYWLDVDQMHAYYDDAPESGHLAAAFAGTPDSSTWRAAGSDWVEW